MTNPYSVGYPYDQGQMMLYNQYSQPTQMQPAYEQYNQMPINPQMYSSGYYSSSKPSLISGVLTAGAVGFAGGAAVTATVDYFRTRKPVKDGKVKESFTKKVMENIIKKDYVFKGKKFFKQKLNVLKNIDAANTPKKFKKLMEKNKEYCMTLCDGISLKTMCDTATKENIKEKIAAIKARAQASLKTEYQNINDAVKLCWDKENKKFIQGEGVDKKLFKIIKNTKNGINWAKSMKYGGITAGIMGILALGSALFTRGSNQ